MDLARLLLLSTIVTHFTVISSRSISKLIGSFGGQNKLKHPSCMDSWIESNKNLRKDIQQYFGRLLGPEIEQEFGERGCHHIVTTTSDDNYFVDVIFRFFSLLVWQRRFYQHHCLEKLVFNESMLRNDGKETYIRQIVDKINQAVHLNIVISESISFGRIQLGQNDLNFLHASDAFLMTNHLLNRPLCLYHGEKEKILQDIVRITLLNQRILNIEDIKKDVFRSDWISYETEFKVMSFDGKSFQDQVKVSADTDIMIGIHGAAFTNAVFMKPCSVLIEVYPWIFNGWNFFDRFTRSSEVLHYTWMESLENSIQPTQNSYSEDCSKVLEPCIQEYYNMRSHTSSNNMTFDGFIGKNSSYANTHLIIDSYGQYDPLISKCMITRDSGACVKCATGITLSIPKLLSVIQIALRDRKYCIMNHPYYTPTDH
eukprot:gene11574-12624_t